MVQANDGTARELFPDIPASEADLTASTNLSLVAGLPSDGNEQLSFELPGTNLPPEDDHLRGNTNDLQQIVQKTARRFNGVSLSRADLEQEGQLSLVRARRNFNPGIGVPFERYAAICVIGGITDAIRDKDRMIRPIRKDSPALGRVREVIAELDNGVTRVEDSQIAARTGMSEIDVRHYRDAPRIAKVESLFKPILSLAHGGTMTLLDVLVGEEDHAPDVVFAQFVHDYLDRLPPDQAAILRFRFGIDPYDEPHTQPETAQHFELSKDQVYRREKAAKQLFRTLVSDE